jgi:hypothetical protein
MVYKSGTYERANSLRGGGAKSTDLLGIRDGRATERGFMDSQKFARVAESLRQYRRAELRDFEEELGLESRKQ